jgi:hypothetical protein
VLAEGRKGDIMEIRGAHVVAERQKIAAMCVEAVDRLIESGQWDELRAPENQLPEAWMPRSFFEYWLRPAKVQDLALGPDGRDTALKE